MGAVCSKGATPDGSPNNQRENGDHACLRLCRCLVPGRRSVPDVHPTPAHVPRRRQALTPDRSHGPTVVPVRYAFQHGSREQDDDDRSDFVFHIPSRSYFPERRNDDIALHSLGRAPTCSPSFDFDDYDDQTTVESCSDFSFEESCFFSPIHLPELVSDQSEGETSDASPPRTPRLQLVRDEACQTPDYQCVLPGTSAAVCQGIPDRDQGAVVYHCRREVVSRAGRRPASPESEEELASIPCPRCGVCHLYASPQFLCGTYCRCRCQDQECCVLCMSMVCPDQPALGSARALQGGELQGSDASEAPVNLPTADSFTGHWNSYLTVTPDLLISDHFTGHEIILDSDTFAFIITGLRISLILILCALISLVLR